MCDDKILVIVCAHNEERYIVRCLFSVINQTKPPSKVVVVDDASTDRTPELLKSFIEEYGGLIKYVRRIRKVEILHTTEIPKTFNFGLRAVNVGDYNYIAKIDADILLFEDYFEKILSEFEKDEKLGIVGGILLNESTKSINGANMILRMKTWFEISENGFMPEVDSEDAFLIFRAQRKGWRVLFLKEARSLHMRPFCKYPLKSIFKQRIRLGRTTYRFGYHPLYFLGRITKVSFTELPYVLTIPLSLYGWVYSWLSKDKVEEDFRAWLKRHQKKRIKQIIMKYFKAIA